jgi:uridine kinase
MIGDIINFKAKYLVTSEAILKELDQINPIADDQKYVIVIAGESGTGKSVTSQCLQKCLDERGVSSFVIYQDDYFKLPPLSNHLNRVKSISNVGSHEVHLNLIQSQLDGFKANEISITKPLVYYIENTIGEETVNIGKYQVLIIEGTYCLSLKNFDFGIFMDRDYKETKQQRIERARDENSDFIEKVLEIEHQIIRPMKKFAHCVVEKDYTVSVNLI